MIEYVYSYSKNNSYLSKRIKIGYCTTCGKTKALYCDIGVFEIANQVPNFYKEERGFECLNCLCNGYKIVKMPQTNKKEAIKAFKDLIIAEML